MKIIILALCFAGVSAQAPAHCVSPPAWEGVITEVDPSKAVPKRYIKLSYDADNEREVYRERHFDLLKRPYYMKKIKLYRENVCYRINMRTRKCERFTLNRPFYDIGVKPSANFTSAGYIGSSVRGAGILVNIFEYNTKDYRLVTMFTQKDCLPVTSSRYSEEKGRSHHQNYYDITLGISNPNIFTPPANCSK